MKIQTCNLLLALALATAGATMATGARADRPSISGVNNKLDALVSVIGQVPDGSSGTVLDQLTAISADLNPNLTRVDPRFVWAAPFNNATWIKGGDVSHFLNTWISAHNASAETQKVRFQGVFGGVVVVEQDVDIPAGQTRVLMADPQFMERRYFQGQALPTTFVVSSNAKVIIEAVVERSRVEPVIIADLPFLRPTQEAGAHSIHFQMLDCADVSYQRTCAIPRDNTDWATFSGG